MKTVPARMLDDPLSDSQVVGLDVLQGAKCEVD